MHNWGGSSYATHVPVLMRALVKTTGDILELGVGGHSTPLIVAISRAEKRFAVSYENNLEWFQLAKERYIRRYNRIKFVEDYDDAPIERPWGLAFIDHEPGLRRRVDIARLANYAQIIVVHDTNRKSDKHYKYSEIYPLFKYRKDFTALSPHTTVLSNFVDLEDF